MVGVEVYACFGNIEIKTFSLYHIDSVVKEPGKDPWCLSCFYGATNRNMRYKTWDTMKILHGENARSMGLHGRFQRSSEA